MNEKSMSPLNGSSANKDTSVQENKGVPAKDTSFQENKGVPVKDNSVPAKNASLQNHKALVLARIRNCNVSSLTLRHTFKDSLMSYKHDKESFTLFVKACVKELSDSLDFFLVKSKATSELLVKFVLLAVEKYVDLTYEDFVLFAKTVMLGGIQSCSGYYTYPKVYERLDGAILMEMLAVYYQAKIDEREAIIAENHKRKKQINESALMGVSQNLNQEWSFQRILDNMLMEKVNELVEKTRNHNQLFEQEGEEEE
jgi:hypothetical protein